MKENLGQFRIIVLIEAPHQKVSITRVLEFGIFSYKNFLKKIIKNLLHEATIQEK